MDFAGLSTKYRGGTATQYTSERTGTKWNAEHDAVRQLLTQIPQGAKTLDIPVGTGRLIPFLQERSFDAHGLDVSPDMLEEARSYADRVSARIHLAQGDIRHIDFPDGHFDLVTCLRFLNWIDEESVTEAMRELVRVTHDKLLIGIRYLPPIREFRLTRSELVRLGMRLVRFPQFRAKRWQMVFHEKAFVERLFAELKLRIVASQHVERRQDGTDYVFFLLQKS